MMKFAIPVAIGITVDWFWRSQDFHHDAAKERFHFTSPDGGKRSVIDYKL